MLKLMPATGPPTRPRLQRPAEGVGEGSQAGATGSISNYSRGAGGGSRCPRLANIGLPGAQ